MHLAGLLAAGPAKETAFLGGLFCWARSNRLAKCVDGYGVYAPIYSEFCKMYISQVHVTGGGLLALDLPLKRNIIFRNLLARRRVAQIRCTPY